MGLAVDFNSLSLSHTELDPAHGLFRRSTQLLQHILCLDASQGNSASPGPAIHQLRPSAASAVPGAKPTTSCQYPQKRRPLRPKRGQYDLTKLFLTSFCLALASSMGRHKLAADLKVAWTASFSTALGTCCVSTEFNRFHQISLRASWI